MSEESHAVRDPSKFYKLAAVAIAVIIAAYIVALVLGYPQKATQFILEAEQHGAEAVEETVPAENAPVPAETETVAPAETETPAPAVEEAVPTSESTATTEDAPATTTEAATTTEDAAPSEAASETAEESAESHAEPTLPPYFMVIPFALLLLAIAILPLIPATEHWWESNLHRFYVAAFLGVITLLYYGFAHTGVLESHWHALSAAHLCDDTAGARMWTIFANAIFDEFVPFIVLLFALFSIAGGIRVEGNLKAKPMTNTIFIAIGAALASFIGTTGAAMLLIRPLLETNKERKFKVHTVIFFIFAVCNCGGCLLPTGDPPLFLGYLAGVGFTWTMCLWKEWLFTNCVLLVIYYMWDRFISYPKETSTDIVLDNVEAGKLKFLGIFPNALLLIGVILAVALLDPKKAFPGTEWHAPMYLREIVQLGLVFVSLVLGNTKVRLNNRFNFGAITEVAALFFGIFICMQVPLQILNEKGGELGMGVDDTHSFFWATGSLSSVLDNAPTYVVFSTVGKTATLDAEKRGELVIYQDGNAKEKSAAEAKVAELKASNSEMNIEAMPIEAGIAAKVLVAVSLGSVFMGAMTYIGNGPNFMVKAIAEEEGVKMPSFFGYMVYSFGILFPILLIMTFLFL